MKNHTVVNPKAAKDAVDTYLRHIFFGDPTQPAPSWGNGMPITILASRNETPPEPWEYADVQALSKLAMEASGRDCPPTQYSDASSESEKDPSSPEACISQPDELEHDDPNSDSDNAPLRPNMPLVNPPAYTGVSAPSLRQKAHRIPKGEGKVTSAPEIAVAKPWKRYWTVGSFFPEQTGRPALRKAVKEFNDALRNFWKDSAEFYWQRLVCVRANQNDWEKLTLRVTRLCGFLSNVVAEAVDYDEETLVRFLCYPHPAWPQLFRYPVKLGDIVREGGETAAIDFLMSVSTSFWPKYPKFRRANTKMPEEWSLPVGNQVPDQWKGKGLNLSPVRFKWNGVDPVSFLEDLPQPLPELTNPHEEEESEPRDDPNDKGDSDYEEGSGMARPKGHHVSRKSAKDSDVPDVDEVAEQRMPTVPEGDKARVTPAHNDPGESASTSRPFFAPTRIFREGGYSSPEEVDYEEDDSA
ncbi:unnamed protein product [Aphanomyces euteiches]